MAKVRTLTDKNKEYIYPVTKASAVYMPNGVDTVDRVINSLRDHGSTVTFDEDGDITKTYESGEVEKIKFVGDYITKKVMKGDVVISSVRIEFKKDGSIETTIEKESEDK